MSKPLDEPQDSANNYIVAKDQEWVQRWEEREQTFRKDVEKNRAEYDRRMLAMNDHVKKLDRTMHEQQKIILKIRSIPIIGERVVRWAGYNP